MAKKLVFIILLVLSMCAISYGQSDFQGITPGVSTRSSVTTALGQPVFEVSKTLIEYAPPPGIEKVYVQYREGSQIVERIEVLLLKPVLRSALILRFNLPDQAAAQQIRKDGKRVEYFGGSALLALTYLSTNTGSGVSRVGYYSRELYDAEFERVKEAKASGVDVPAAAIRPMQMENEVSLDGTNITYYPRSSVDQCKADCENNPMCKGFTWIREGTYNPGDSAMCYLMSAVTRKIPTRGHVSGVKE